MKFSPPRLLTAVLLGGLLTWLLAWRPFSADTPAQRYLFEMVSNAPVTGGLLLKIDEGHGFATSVSGGRKASEPNSLFAELPPGRVRKMQALVYEMPSLEVARMRIRTIEGELFAEIPWSQVAALPGTAAQKGEAAVTLTKTQSASDHCGLEIDFPETIFIPSGNEPWAVEAAGMFALLSGLLYFILLRLPAGLSARVEPKLAALTATAQRRPILTLVGVALGATILNCHPLLFCGKSLVSPNNQSDLVPLLYSTQPTVPGAEVEPQEQAKGADLGAMMWQTQTYSALVSRTILRDGELPLWNRHSAGGVSLLAQHLSMAADPLNLLTLWAEGAWWAWDLRFVLAKALFALGIGLCAWRVSRSLGAAALLAASSVYIGYFAFRFNHAAIFGVCYAPWILLPWLSAIGETSRRRLWLWALALIAADWAELNSGTGKESSMLLLCMNGAGLFAVLMAAAPWRERLQRAGLLAGASVIFLLLSAPCWLLFIDALRNSFTVYDDPVAYQLQPGLMIGFFEGIFLQDFAKLGSHTSPSLNFLVLAGVLWLFAGGRAWRTNRAALALTLAAAAPAALVFGIVPPGWITKLPLLGNILHIHNTFGCVLLVLLLVLAAVGLKDCAETAGTPEWTRAWRRVLCALLVLLLAYLGFTQAIPQPPYNVFRIEAPLHSRFFLAFVPFLLLAALALPWAIRAILSKGVYRAAGAAALAVCLVVIHFRHGLYVGTKFDEYVQNPKTGAALQAETLALDRLRRRIKEPVRTVGFGDTFFPGYNVLLELESISGAEPLINPWYRQLYTAAKIKNEWGWRLTVEEETVQQLRPIYDLLGIRFYLREPLAGAAAVPGLNPVTQADLEILESPTAWPRAFFTDHVQSYRTPAEFAQLVSRGDGRPAAAVQSASPVSMGPAYAQRQVEPARDYTLTPNTTAFTITAPGRGVAVLGESFEEGNFQVTVNGAPAKYLRINHAFKGVALPEAGEYRIKFTYWPRMLTPALWMSGAGLVLALAASVAAFSPFALRRKEERESFAGEPEYV